MAQDRESGRKASQWGHETARKIAKAIGVEITGRYSNECVYQGQPATIKCAAPRTTSVGVTYLTLKRIKLVIGAFQESDGSFILYSLPADVFDRQMRATRSTGAASGKVGLVARAYFQQNGRYLQKVNLGHA